MRRVPVSCLALFGGLVGCAVLGCGATGAPSTSDEVDAGNDTGPAGDATLPLPDGDTALLFEVEGSDTGGSEGAVDAPVDTVPDGCTSCPVTTSGTICGVSVALLPFYAHKGGGFQSGPLTGTSSAITVSFGAAVQNVTVTVHDPGAGNQMVAYFGKGICNTQNFDAAPGGESTRTTACPSITKVVLQPGAGDYVWYDNLSFMLCK